MWERYCRGVNAILYVFLSFFLSFFFLSSLFFLCALDYVGGTLLSSLSLSLLFFLPFRLVNLPFSFPFPSSPSPFSLFPFPFSLLFSPFRYVVDAADHDKFETTKKELHDLLSKPPLSRIPLLVVGNKNDLLEAVTQEQLIEILYVFFLLLPIYFYFSLFSFSFSFSFFSLHYSIFISLSLS